MYTYIKCYGQNYFELPEKLPSETPGLGMTWEDYLNRKIVCLSEEQTKFHIDHPEATVKQVWDMNMPVPPTPPERTLEIAKAEKIQNLEEYDSSDNVNLFYIDNKPVWLDKGTRVGLRFRFESEQAMEITDTMLWYKDQNFNLNVDQAIQMLRTIELYASACYDNTCRHRTTIGKLETIEEVDDYDYTVGYPEKLYFISNKSEI